MGGKKGKREIMTFSLISSNKRNEKKRQKTNLESEVESTCK